jgi:hypothetical protein
MSRRDVLGVLTGAAEESRVSGMLARQRGPGIATASDRP